ncbi:MAG: hypothetical protein HY666_01480 [Chloroflexi bacterium]|nr:hypothetical protein [Chloroflexota bacterium]
MAANDHLNIFNAYRGQVGEDPERQQGQLENNVTRALVITLKNLPTSEQTKVLQRWLGSEFQGHSNDNRSGLKYRLQEKISTVTPELRLCKYVWVIGISATGEQVEKTVHDGDLPDAWVFGDRWAIALEIKTGEAALSRQQLGSYQKNIESQAPHAEVKCLSVSWHRHISPVLDRLSEEVGVSDVSHFLVKQCKEYLEMEGLGTLSFVRADFLDWEKKTSALKSKLRALSQTLASCLGDYEVHMQKVQDDYIGSNLLHNDFHGKQPYQVPHWSLGLGRYERRIRLFVQCEGIKLSKLLVSQKDQLEGPLTAALRALTKDVRMRLRVEEKWLVMPNGQGERAPLYPIYFAASLADCPDQKSLQEVVRKALESVNTVNSSRQRIVQTQCLDHFNSRTIIGVLQLEFSMNWFEMEDLGPGIADVLRAAALRMKSYFEVLRQYGGTA